MAMKMTIVGRIGSLKLETLQNGTDKLSIQVFSEKYYNGEVHTSQVWITAWGARAKALFEKKILEKGFQCVFYADFEVKVVDNSSYMNINLEDFQVTQKPQSYFDRKKKEKDGIQTQNTIEFPEDSDDTPY